MPRHTRAYWVKSPGIGELRDEPIADEPAPGHSLIRAEFGSVSPGTERLVGTGRAAAAAARCGSAIACRHMAGDFGLPVKYGYSLVGTGLAGALAGHRVFVMHPHQEIVEIRDAEALRLPADLPGPRATMIPNTETAWNAVQDAELAPGEAAVVVGAGPVGLLLAFVLDGLGFERPVLVDTDEARLDTVRRMPFVADAITPAATEPGARAVAFHTTGTGAGLQTALDSVGFEGRVIELSWYPGAIEIDLGAGFHFGRKRILASQVGQIAAPVRDKVTFAERSAQVLELLSNPAADALLATPTGFSELPALMHAVYAGTPPFPIPLIDYSR